MGVRDRFAQLRKVFGPNVPAAVLAGESAAGMMPSSPFSPGQPIGPYDGYSRTPRSQDFITGYNIATRPRTHERVSFDTLRGLVNAYDVAQIAIWHRIDSIRSLDWSLVAKPGFSGDVADAIKVGMEILKKPDRTHPFDTWLGAWLFDVLAYDAGSLYRMRNRAGRAIGLMNVDGTTLAPLLSYWGTPPEPDAPAFVQYAQGLPWNWLTQRDLIYTPFRKVNDSPYGKAPLESILLNANTDLRFQAYFLQRFTSGNIPAAFASAPETWTPQQIEQFQSYWDAFMLGDQAAKSQIKWIPGGSKIDFTNEREFTDTFSLFLMRKTLAALHVVPADVGFTENVNKSSGESQADVQHRIGDLPLLRKIQGVLSGFLQDDAGLPLDFLFDLGEEQADRYQQAQADKIYVELGAISSSDIRQMRYGLEEAEGEKVPRFIYTERSGPIPLSSLYAVAGQIDAETAAPEPGAPLSHEVFGGTEGVLPNPPIKVMSLAERMYGPSAMPPAPPPQPVLQSPEAKQPGQLPSIAGDVTKDGGVTAGITTATGITSYDLVGHNLAEDDEDEVVDVEVDKAAELAAYRRFAKDAKRRKRWRDFEFASIDPITAHRLNDAGRANFRIAKGEIAVAGLAVRALDTGRILMLQRGLDPEDPAAGLWEMPGGHVETGEDPFTAAVREWQEETGILLPASLIANGPDGTWVSSNGIYQGFVLDAPSEGIAEVDGRGQVVNPDDPDGDVVEATAWWNPALLDGNPAIRLELEAEVTAVLAALDGGQIEKAATLSKPRAHYRDPSDVPSHSCGNCSMFQAAAGSAVGTCTLVQGRIDPGAVCDHWLPAVGDKVAKAGGHPKASGQSADWPGWQHDHPAADYWAKRLNDELGEVLPQALAEQLARDYAATNPGPRDGRTDAELAALALIWLETQNLDLAPAVAAALDGMRLDGAAIGAASAAAVLDGHKTANLGDWKPGVVKSARTVLAGHDIPQPDPADPAGSDVQGIAETRRKHVARALALGTAAGLTAATAGSRMRDALVTGLKAVAIYEIVSAVSKAAMTLFGRGSVQLGQWTVDPRSKVCSICLTNAAVGPRPLGQPYPSGHSNSPAHVGCACAVLPA